MGGSKFLGYEATTARSEIVALVAGGQEVTQVTGPSPGPVGVITRDSCARF